MDSVNVPAKFEVCGFTLSCDNSGYLKIFGSPRIRPRCLFSKFFYGLLFGWTCECTTKIEVSTFTHPWDNRGYLKTLGSPSLRPRPLFSKMFNRLLFGWTMWMYRPNLKSVHLPIPEIIGGTWKLWAVIYAVQGHQRSLILVPIESAYETSLVRHSNLIGPILHRFGDIADFFCAPEWPHSYISP